MKRLISMMLAVMLIATLGAVTAFAEHPVHYIQFEGGDSITLPAATDFTAKKKPNASIILLMIFCCGLIAKF